MSGIPKLFKQELWKATYPLVTDNIKADLIRNSAITSAHVRSVAGCTAATPGVVTLAASSVIVNGDIVSLSGIGGITGATGRFKAAGVSGSGGATPTFQLTDVITGASVATTGTYTSGGWMVNLTTIQFRSAVDAGARVATSGNLGSKTFTLGVFSFAAFTFTAVATGAACQMIGFFDDTPATDGAKPYIVFDDGATGLPVTPNSGDITYTPNASGLAEL